MKCKTNSKRSEPEIIRADHNKSIGVPIYFRVRPYRSGNKAKIWTVVDRTQGWRDLREFRDRDAARAEAKRIANHLSRGEIAAASLSNADATAHGRAMENLKPTGTSVEVAAATYARAVEALKPTGASVDLAVDVYVRTFQLLEGDSIIEAAKFYASHSGHRVVQITVPKVVDELLKVKKKEGARDRYIADLRARLNRFAKSFKSESMSNITTGQITHWLQKLKVSPQTRRNFKTVIGTLFYFGEARDYITKGANPFKGVQEIKVPSSEIQIYTPEEVAALLKSAPDKLVPVIAISAFAGVRRAELERLNWEDFDFEANLIHVSKDKAKTPANRNVPILPNLAAWLSPFVNSKGPVWDFNSRRMREAMHSDSEVNGIQNGFRHSWISYRLADTKNVDQVAYEAGNSRSVIFANYHKPVKQEMAKAYFAVMPEPKP